MSRNVLQEVQKTIQRKCVVMTEKTKWRGDKGGKQLVSVGPYRKAVGPSSYVVIGKGWEKETKSSRDAAQMFVDFVGRDKAWDAVRRAQRKCNLK